jgi:hypothetical protein
VTRAIPGAQAPPTAQEETCAGGNSKKLMLKSAEHVGEDLGKVFKAF